MVRLLFNLRGPLIMLPHPLTRLIVSNTRQWPQWIQVGFFRPPLWVDKKGNHLHAGDMFKWGKVRWIKMQLNSFLMLWPNYAPIFLLSFFFPHRLVISHSTIFRIGFDEKKVSADSLVLCSFADYELNLLEDLLKKKKRKREKCLTISCAETRWTFSFIDRLY